jgi:hypothetical protein
LSPARRGICKWSIEPRKIYPIKVVEHLEGWEVPSMFKKVPGTVTGANSLIFDIHKADVTETLTPRSGGGEDLDERECLAQVDRLVSSPLLQGSEALCKLLQHLAHHTLYSPTDHLKEYQIAVEVLGRSPDFDPQSDSSVRVQVGRLRSKLAEYYHSTGIDDPILIDVPKGKYTLLFERRAATPQAETASEDVAVASGSTAPRWKRRGVVLALGVMAGLLLAGGALIYWLHARAVGATARLSGAGGVPAALQLFWSPFLHGSDEPFVVFSNATFVGSPETGMRYFEPAKDSRDQMTQHYTGVGEVMGVLELDRLFRQFGEQFRVKRGGLFTLDDARSNNLIFVGSPMENLALGQIPNAREFAFRQIAAGKNHSRQVIVDLDPRPGENSVYPPTPETRPEDPEYAVVALMRGLDPSRWTLILAGTSTIGTQAAVDYVCDPSSLEELLHRLNVTRETDLKPFEALLRIQVANDVPLKTQLAALRRTDH